jgi:2-amino-4-hydroxy-6-hydroxymethyldihydropteridine diphosphokinase
VRAESHTVYLSLGSNIEPESNLRRAIELLKQDYQVTDVSMAWENQAVGAVGAPNFLNACVSLLTALSAPEFIEHAIRPVESSLGRTRSDDPNASRTIDIDIILYDGQPMRLEYWHQAFMVVPLAELLPGFIDPVSGEPLSRAAKQALKNSWMLPRPEVLQGC